MAHALPELEPDGEIDAIDDEPPVTLDEDEFHVLQPAEDVEPEAMSITVDGVRYRFSDYQGKATRSRIYAEVLVYGTCEIVEVADDA